MLRTILRSSFTRTVLSGSPSPSFALRGCAAATRALATHAPTATAQLAPPRMLEDMTATEQNMAPMFTMSQQRGFLPRQDPLAQLPDHFAEVESLLNRMTIVQPDGSKGLLAKGVFGDTVLSELGDEKVYARVMKGINDAIAVKDQPLISALFRDYCFLTSAYLLEPVDISFRATGKYVPGRSVLPKCLAVPIKALADELGHFPFMEYASSYALVNYRRVLGTDSSAPSSLGPAASWETDNLRLIRAFEDPNGSEAGFILVHISMVAHSGRLVVAAEDVLKAAHEGEAGRASFDRAMEALDSAYSEVNKTMATMWGWSRPIDYLKFRSFIFGTGPKKMNAMFPEGVIYEGVSKEPMAFRGESGANDSIVPLGDNLLEITSKLPKNELADILRDFRKYRPHNQRTYIETLEHRAVHANVADFAKGSEESLARYILNVDQIRQIRDRHWHFTKEYIIKRSDYPIATGGSPILAYLPQNLTVVIDVLAAACASLPAKLTIKDASILERVEKIRARVQTQKAVLQEEVDRLKGEVKGMDDKRSQRFEMEKARELAARKAPTMEASVGCDGVG